MSSLTPEMLISDVLAACPGAADVFAAHGLSCPSCLAAGMESLSVVASAHDVDVMVLIEDLNKLGKQQPKEQ